jgi:signal transduction histidine kinase
VRVGERTAALRRANAELEAEVAERRHAEESLRDLSGRLLHLQDEERRRIARELHDSTTQLLAASAISIDQAHHLVDERGDSRLAGLLRDSMASLERVRQEIRTVSYLLHPPILDELGLEYVLRWYAEGFRQRSGIAVELDVRPQLGRLPDDVEMAFFRITQEALTNVRRHSGSHVVRIALTRDDESATLTISDLGRGIPPGVLDGTGSTIANLGVGIAGMRERVRQLGGKLQIEGTSKGTIICAVLPVSPLPAAER